jgi:DNA polymerase
MTQAHDPHLLAALLDWQAELGADEAVGDAPVDRYAAALAARPAAPAGPAPAPAQEGAARGAAGDPVAEAAALAAGAADLAALAAAQSAFDRCDLKRGARSFVFADGLPGARVMIVGEAPGRDEDMQGKPFVGRAGQLLDRMFAAIGMARGHPDAGRALYITNVLPWRPPGNRDPEPAEMAMMLPFARRHVELAAPELLVLMGNTPCAAFLGQRGITRIRGRWTEVLGRPVLPMLHPAYLLRNPAAKREAWADLLTLQARLRAP